jgi:hypothetical protein
MSATVLAKKSSDESERGVSLLLPGVAPEDPVPWALPSVEGFVLSENDTTPVVLVVGVMPEDCTSNDADVIPEDARTGVSLTRMIGGGEQTVGNRECPSERRIYCFIRKYMNVSSSHFNYGFSLCAENADLNDAACLP